MSHIARPPWSSTWNMCNQISRRRLLPATGMVGQERNPSQSKRLKLQASLKQLHMQPGRPAGGWRFTRACLVASMPVCGTPEPSPVGCAVALLCTGLYTAATHMHCCSHNLEPVRRNAWPSTPHAMTQTITRPAQAKLDFRANTTSRGRMPLVEAAAVLGHRPLSTAGGKATGGAATAKRAVRSKHQQAASFERCTQMHDKSLKNGAVRGAQSQGGTQHHTHKPPSRRAGHASSAASSAAPAAAASSAPGALCAAPPSIHLGKAPAPPPILMPAGPEGYKNEGPPPAPRAARAWLSTSGGSVLLSVRPGNRPP